VVSLGLALCFLAAIGSATGLEREQGLAELFSFRRWDAGHLYLIYVLNALGIGALNIIVPSGRVWWLIPLFNSVACVLLFLAWFLLAPALGPSMRG
jgi:hypothetical protein